MDYPGAISGSAPPLASQAIVFVARRSSAWTASSRCSGLVSSSFVCERPRRLCTNSITVGTPERDDLGGVVQRPAREPVRGSRHLANRLVAEVDQRLVEEDRLDRPDPLPLDLDVLLGGEPLARRPAPAASSSRQRCRVEVPLVEELLGRLDDRRDDARARRRRRRTCRRRRRRPRRRSRGSRARASPHRRAHRGACPSGSSRHVRPGRAR